MDSHETVPCTFNCCCAGLHCHRRTGLPYCPGCGRTVRGAPPADGTEYGETRQFVDTQAWWVPDIDQANNSITNTGHVHLGACLPERETISSGNLTVKVRVILHETLARRTTSPWCS